MARIARQLTDLVGNTPLLEFSNFNASKGFKALARVEIRELPCWSSLISTRARALKPK